MKKILIILLYLFLFSCEKNIENKENNLTWNIDKTSFSWELENNLILYKYEILPEIEKWLEKNYISYPHSWYYLEKEKFKEVDKKDFIWWINFDLNWEKAECLENEKKHISRFYNFSNCIPKYYVAENEIWGPFSLVTDWTSLFTKWKEYDEIDIWVFDFRENSILLREYYEILSIGIFNWKKYFLKLEKNWNYYSIDMFDENKKYLRTALIMEKFLKEEKFKDEKYFSIIFDKFELDNIRFLETMRILEK